MISLNQTNKDFSPENNTWYTVVCRVVERERMFVPPFSWHAGHHWLKSSRRLTVALERAHIACHLPAATRRLRRARALVAACFDRTTDALALETHGDATAFETGGGASSGGGGDARGGRD